MNNSNRSKEEVLAAVKLQTEIILWTVAAMNELGSNTLLTQVARNVKGDVRWFPEAKIMKLLEDGKLTEKDGQLFSNAKTY